jgi:hypothetical protein
MVVSFNTKAPNVAYMRELYSSGPGTGQGQVNEAARQPPDSAGNRDSLFISAEARRMYHVNQALNVNENILDQQGDIYRPGQEQTVMRSDFSLKVDRNERQAPEAAPPPERTESIEPEVMEINRNQSAGRVENNSPAAERDNNRRVEQVQTDNQSVNTPAGITNTVNRSDLLQAYSAAANVNQASYIVNYKV